jgi:tetratricopeptide (TPR) repeat protein
MRAGALLLVAAGACSVPRGAKFPDAPLELRDDGDRDQAIDQLWLLPAGAQRDAVRAHVSEAIAKRIGDAIEDDKPYVAEQLLFQWCSLWRDDPTAVSRDLQPYLPVIHRLRAMFAKAGTLEPTIATLVLLTELEPAQRVAHLAELHEVAAFADELATTADGPDATRAQPIALLQPTALALPLPWLVDRYVALLEARQRTFVQIVGSGDPDDDLARTHADVLVTAHRIANVLARAGRADDIHAHLDQLTGIYGTDRMLALRADTVAEQPSADAYLQLARALRDDHDAGDAAAALGVAVRGIAKFPRSAALYATAAEAAAELGRLDQPIGLYEAALAVDTGELDSTLALRLGRLYSERIARLALGGRPAAAESAWRDLVVYTRDEDRRTPNEVWRQVNALGQSSLGRGLISQGRLADAEHELVASLDRAPSVDAYETLVTIELRTDHLRAARRYANAGLALLPQSSCIVSSAGDQRECPSAADRYHRAKLARLAGDVALAAGHTRDGNELYLESMKAWASLGKDDDLPRAIAAERKLEFARALSRLGDIAKAVDLAAEAVDTDPSSPATSTQAIAFLLEIDRASDALDILHRALGSEIGEPYEVYACLWVVVDARHRNALPDRLAVDYLAGRHGELWYERLAQAATHRLEFAQLAALPVAQTPAALRARLHAVVDAGLVMEPEYEIARRYLGGP